MPRGKLQYTDNFMADNFAHAQLVCTILPHREGPGDETNTSGK